MLMSKGSPELAPLPISHHIMVIPEVIWAWESWHVLHECRGASPAPRMGSTRDLVLVVWLWENWHYRTSVGQPAPPRQPRPTLGKCGRAGHNGMGVSELALPLASMALRMKESWPSRHAHVKICSAPHLARAGAGLIV